MDDQASVPNTSELLSALERHLEQLGFVPSPGSMSDAEQHRALAVLLGSDPAPEVVAWFRFTERWSEQPFAPWSMITMNLATSVEEHGEFVEYYASDGGFPHRLPDVPDAPDAPDAIVIGSDFSGDRLCLTPATGSERIRIAQASLERAFLNRAVVGDEPDVLTSFDEWPLFDDWLACLVARYDEHWVGRFDHNPHMVDVANPDREHGDWYPWPDRESPPEGEA